MNHSRPQSNAESDAAIRDTAARWVVRQDRRLTSAETAELEVWLAADPRHAVAHEQSAASWRRVRGIAAVVRRTPIKTDRPRAQLSWISAVGLAAAAALAFALFVVDRTPEGASSIPRADSSTAAAAVVPGARALADGSLIQLRDGAEIAVAFSASERRVRLVRGEAFFLVAKDAARPFLVEIGDVTVRAVGTAFAVRYEPQAVDVLVTEGVVRVVPTAPDPASHGAAHAVDASALVGAGQRAVVAHEPVSQTPSVVVTTVAAEEIANTLAWGERMLELAGSTLGELVTKFTYRSGQRIEIEDTKLATVRIGGQFPTNDVDGFLRALEVIYGVESENRPDGVVVLRRKR